MRPSAPLRRDAGRAVADVSLLVVLGALVPFGILGVALSGCAPARPEPPRACDPAGLSPRGCLSDEVCVDFRCVPKPRCAVDADCGDVAYRCVLPAQICALRPGFGEECREPEAPCPLGQFCALGVCRTTSDTVPCARRTDCPVGQKCDPVHALCIPDGDCRLAAELPELACDSGEVCDALTGQCTLQCQNECTRATEQEDCGPGQRCDSACRCVQCLTDADCGAGLECNVRAGRCQSVNLCFSDVDCDAPLVCDSATQLCQVPPPPCADDFDCLIGSVCDLASGRCVTPDGPCRSDRFEDADTPARAEVFVLAPGEIRLEDDLTLCPNDDDVYAVSLAEGDVLVATVTNTLPQARATMFLLDETAEISLRFTEMPPRGDGRLTYAAPRDQTVFLRITTLLAATPYDLTLERLSGTACAPDVFEAAGGNEAPLSAAVVPAALDAQGLTLNANICGRDVDVYRVDMAPGEVLSAELAFNGTLTDLDLALLDASGAILAQSSGVAAPERLRRRFANAQSAFVRVRGFGGREGPYALTLVREPPFVCAPDSAEPDGVVGSAPTLLVGEGLGPIPRTMCQGDTDLVVVTLEDFERLVVQAQLDDADGDLVVEVLDAAANLVLARSPAAAGGAAVAYDARAPLGTTETVVVRVRASGGTIAPYTLRVARENQFSCAPDVAEPNNIAAAAALLSDLADSNPLFTICESDQDFFAVEGRAGKVLIAEASFRQAEGDIDLMLLGLDGSQILTVADGVADGERLEALLPLDGRYTLRVFSLTSGARVQYGLRVSQVTP